MPPPLAPAPEEPEEAVEDASSPVEAPFAPPPRSSPLPPVFGVELQEVRARTNAKAPDAVTKADQRTRIVVMASQRWPFNEPIARPECTRTSIVSLDL